MTDRIRPRGVGDLIADAREVVDSQWADHLDGSRLYHLLDIAEDYYLMYGARGAADWLMTVARNEDLLGARDVLRDLADDLNEGQ